MIELVDELNETCPEFRAWWPQHEVFGAPKGRHELNHPQVGHLVFTYLTFQVYDAPDLKASVNTPVDEAVTVQKPQTLLSERTAHAEARTGSIGSQQVE